jgi:hypothetical protein
MKILLPMALPSMLCVSSPATAQEQNSEKASGQQAKSPTAESAPAKPPVSLEALKGGTLIRYGVSLGGAYALHIPARWTDFTAEDSNSSFMPYIALYPFMYFPKSGAETRAYCSAAWMLTRREDAQTIADDHAILRAGYSKAEADLSEEERQDIERSSRWDLDDPPYCWYRLIGIYVGKPLAISPTIKPAAPLKDATPTSASIASFGLAWSPNTAFSLMAGLTLWRFSTDMTTDSSANENRSYWTYTFGIGGNLDIIGSLVK